MTRLWVAKSTELVGHFTRDRGHCNARKSLIPYPGHHPSPMASAESILEIVVGTPFLLTALAVFAALIYW